MSFKGFFRKGENKSMEMETKNTDADKMGRKNSMSEEMGRRNSISGEQGRRGSDADIMGGRRMSESSAVESVPHHWWFNHVYNRQDKAVMDKLLKERRQRFMEEAEKSFEKAQLWE